MGIITLICHLIFISAFININLFPLRVDKMTLLYRYILLPYFLPYCCV